MLDSKSQNGRTASTSGVDAQGVSDAGMPNRASLYVWDLPVRITHWVNVITILLLSVTGLYIQDPFIITRGDASEQFLMGSIRFVHFLVAFIFTANVLFRIYWSFTGSTYALWHQFLPYTKARQKSLGRMIGYYFFFRKEPPAMIGHNPMAGLMYTLIHIFFVLQIVTGFALYSLAFHEGFWPAAFGWINGLLGIPNVRLVHEIAMFLILGFVIQHVYSAILMEIEERSGLLGSIVTGYKSLTVHHIKESSGEVPPSKNVNPIALITKPGNKRGK